jgi:hypothetical protein
VPTYSIYKNIVGLVTKGYHGCKCCGPSIKTRWLNDLWKLVYGWLRVFLLEDHLYRATTSSFNGKQKRTRRPEIMILTYWLKVFEPR